MSAPVLFKIDIPQGTLDAIAAKVRAYEWHEMPEIAHGADRWAYGTDMVYMRELCDYWQEKYDWRKAEANLNRFPQFKTTVGDQEIHFIHVKGSGTKPETLLLTHGWPGSVFEFFDVIEQLAHPEKFGGNAEDGVNLVVPSLPGYGFSGKPKKPIGPKRHRGALGPADARRTGIRGLHRTGWRLGRGRDRPSWQSSFVEKKRRLQGDPHEHVGHPPRRDAGNRS